MTVVTSQSNPAQSGLGADSATNIGRRIQDLVGGCGEHRALKNRFYATWRDRQLPVEQVEVFARNFFERAQYGAKYIALAFLQMTTTTAMVETAENLFEEMGNGDPARVHAVLLRDFLEDLLTRMHGREVKLEDIKAPVLESTTRLIHDGDTVFKSMSTHEVCGALLAKEWHAYTQLVFLYEGVRNYMDHYLSLEEFHEHCEYFYVHIGATEKEHKYNSLAAATRACQSEDDFAAFSRGFHTYLDLLADNWDEIHDCMQSAQPA
jgi:heme oxygenase-like protein